jgi:hypothetical protein
MFAATKFHFFARTYLHVTVEGTALTRLSKSWQIRGKYESHVAVVSTANLSAYFITLKMHGHMTESHTCTYLVS